MKKKEKVLFLPKKNEVIKLVENIHFKFHDGITKTYQQFKEKNYFHLIHPIVNMIVKECQYCSEIKHKRKLEGKIKLTEESEYLNRIEIDHVDVSKRFNNYYKFRYFLTGIEVFSRKAVAILTTTREKNETITALEKIFLNLGIPKIF